MSSVNNLDAQIQEENKYFSEERIAEMEKTFNPDKSVDEKFALATILTKSQKETTIRRGIQYFKDILMTFGVSYEHKRDCLYLISKGLFAVGDCEDAKKYLNTLLSEEPNNSQAKHLLELITKKIERDNSYINKFVPLGLLGAGIVGGVAVVGILSLAYMSSRRKQ